MAPTSGAAAAPRRGKAALDQLYRGVTQPGRPLLFLDFDDVFCLNTPYGGYDVFQVADERPADLWERLWHPSCVAVLNTVLDTFDPHVVITTSWLRLLDKEGFLDLFALTGMGRLSQALHPRWEAPPMRGDTRFGAIERWLHAHYEGQPMAVFDDPLSGTGLAKSRLFKTGRIVLCETKVGLHDGLMPAIRHAFRA